MSHHAGTQPIAIVGSACRFAGSANSPSKLWDILSRPKDLRRQVPASRFSSKGFYHPDGTYHGHSNVKHAYLLDESDDPRAFDAEFFGIKPAEAKAMDPQQRVLLEIVYEALEAAGLPLASLRGSNTAVYVGSMTDDYTALLLRDLQNTPTYTATGTARSILANRISHAFDWHGPSVSLDTACSASLVAVHMAVQTLRAGDSRTALACGTNLILGPENFVIESKLSMLSPDGRSRMWDQGANGYARGDGVAAVVLKTLAAALEDGDRIECVIRETGVNQDGATAGITMPSAAAQEALIRQTYAKAGLDLTLRSDRPQYFEAHGTGTPAGDPVEAEAIHSALGFRNPDPGEDPLYVGSIKTVLGHTEGTAGVAAVLKASLALQHARVPPNLWLEQISRSVAPFYKNVEVPVELRPWPAALKGATRRASVNSFGFGGTNAHAILESYADERDGGSQTAPTSALFTPFLFSAFSQQSLAASLHAYLAYLDRDNGEHVDLLDLAWTLRQRRSVLGWRKAITASSLEELRSELRACPADNKNDDAASIVIGLRAFPPTSRTRILGIFTGQGAQYAGMGAELLRQSETARKIVRQLESYLADLPDGDAPAWSLEAELLAGTSSSRIHDAAISQPLCSTVQILLIDLLRFSDLRLDAVVGHSSGEIAAAYSAGFLTARDAMCIAYYRGLHLQHATSPRGPGVRGAMMAVGTTAEDAAELCADSLFKGRLVVASINSPASVTIAGDEDAVGELEAVLQDDDIFCRRLRVDRAYHSPHMRPCHDPYVESLRRCGVAPVSPAPEQHAPTWFSTVYAGVTGAEVGGLGDMYWAANMVQPVQFSQAVSRALGAGVCDLVVEIGPHPALRGPVCQIAQNDLGGEIPYHGTLERGTDSVKAMSATLGFLWMHLDQSRINLDKYEREVSGGARAQPPKLVKGLPTYSWDHAVQYWHESRRSRKLRTRAHRVHPLLGDVSPDSSPIHMSWNQILNVGEMEWLSGHRVQDQIVFPAAGYVCTVLEAARFVARAAYPGRDIRLIEIHDFTIHQPVSFDDARERVEALIAMTEIKQRAPGKVTAFFNYSVAQPSQQDQNLTLAASCRVDILIGATSPSLLPARKPTLPHMIDVEPERFYAHLAELGYGFSGRFRSLSGMYRKHGRSTCCVDMAGPLHVVTQDADDMSALLIHPATLDGALQSIILARAHPFDEEIRTLHLPTSIRQIRVNPGLFKHSQRQHGERAVVDAAVVEPDVGSQEIIGHANMYLDRSAHATIQVQGATFVRLGGSAAEEDRKVFSKTHWILSRPDGDEAARHIALTEGNREVVKVLERIAIFYLRRFVREFAGIPRPAAGGPTLATSESDRPLYWYLNFAEHVTSAAELGRNPWVESAWVCDTLGDVVNAGRPFSHIPDVPMMHLVGAQMPRVFAGETTMLEQFRTSSDGILDKYYTDGFGVKESAEWVGRSVRQIADRYAHMKILEIGAGTGGGTKAVLRELGRNFLSYTYTDISAAFFEEAASTFSSHKDRMHFRTLDAERDPAEQGFAEGEYDLVVAFLMLHATSDVARCLSHIRKLLKPGGFLVAAEGHDAWDGFARAGFIWGTLPGWWLRAGSGEQHGADAELSPHLSPREWDGVLRTTGFSGVDSSLPVEHQQMFSQFCFVSQVTNDDVRYLQQPLLAPSPRGGPIPKLVLVGGQTPITRRLVHGLRGTFTNRVLAAEVHHFETLLEVDHSVADVTSTVLSLAELDQPVFKDMGPDTFNAMKAMFSTGKILLWVTSGRLDDQPYCNMTVGFGNVAVNETPDLRLQQLDIADAASIEPEVLAEALLRLHASAETRDDEVLWTVEPEIVIDNKRRELLPRVRPMPELNDRYNSGRRSIVRHVEPRERPGPVALRYEPKLSNRFVIRERRPVEYDTGEPGIELRTLYSSLSAVHTASLGYKFLALALAPGTGTKYLALVPALGSNFRLPVQSVVPYIQPLNLPDDQVLPVVASHLVAMEVLRPLLPGQTLLAHDPSSTMARALAAQAAAKGIKVVVLSTGFAEEDQEEDLGGLIQLPAYASESEVEQLLLHVNPSFFVDFSNDGDAEQTANQATLISWLRGRCCVLMPAATLYSFQGAEGQNIPGSESDLRKALDQCLEHARQDFDVGKPSLLRDLPVPIPLGYVASGAEQTAGPMSVVDWTATDALPGHISRLDSEPVFRSQGCTYWIVGMSRALGLSLADWMISKGAKNVVLSSRKPEIDSRWIAAHRETGANVVILPCDVTDAASLQAVYSQIHATLPPVAGVINGAMVLRDTTIRNMSFAQLTDVLGPKVTGSIHLDRLFQHTNLDFFVLMSSINRVYGNHGQANYAAANSFLWSLAAQRRKRGLRATAVDIGAIIGAGYLARELRRELDAIVERYNMLRMSEEDWCQAICEAIHACRLEFPHGPGLTTGFAEVPLNAPKPPSWHENPVFSAFVVSQGSVQEKAEVKAAVEMGEQLRACQSSAEVWQVVSRFFAAQLRAVLQVTLSDEHLMASRSSDLGLDSLVSVDIRSWFLKHLQVNVPVLKIMNNDTMATLVQYVIDNTPASLVPELGASDEPISSGTQTLRAASEDGDMLILPGKVSDPPTMTANTIDWEAESRPPAAMAAEQTAAASLPRPHSPPRIIILTGSTGLLGRHLLTHLLALPSIGRVICLAVRSLATRLLPSTDPRVTYHAGDLSDPLLGLTPANAAALFATASAAIHNGADTSHLQPYSAVRAANVGSTTALARLCLRHGVTLHYVSSAGLGLWHADSRTAGFAPGPVRLNPGWEPDGSFGYLCSKWVCERLLERMSAAFGLRVCIHRPSTVVREGGDAVGGRAERDWVNAFLAYARILGAVPRAETNRGFLDLVYVESVCEALIAQVFYADDGDGDGDGSTEEARAVVRYVHEVGDRRLPLGELQHVINPVGVEETLLEAISGQEWIARARAAGLHPGVAALIESMIETGEDYPKLLKGVSSAPPP